MLLGGCADREELAVLLSGVLVPCGLRGPGPGGDACRDDPIDLGGAAVGLDDAGDGGVGHDEEPVGGVGAAAAQELEEGGAVAGVGVGRTRWPVAGVGVDQEGSGAQLGGAGGNAQVEPAVEAESVRGRLDVVVGHGEPLHTHEELGLRSGKRADEEDASSFSTCEVVDLSQDLVPGVPVDPDGDVRANRQLPVAEPGVHGQSAWPSKRRSQPRMTGMSAGWSSVYGALKL